MQEFLTRFFSDIKPHSVVETGTHLGQGTTAYLYNALRAAGLPNTPIVTVECNRRYYSEAVKYFHSHGMHSVMPMYGLSIPRYLAPTPEMLQREFVDMEDTVGGTVYYDHKPHERAALYAAEVAVTHDTPDDMLARIVNDETIPPVKVFLLDSAGSIGQLEFQYLIGLLQKKLHRVTCPFYVILVATRHCKHKRTVDFIKKVPGWHMLHENTDGFGWVVAELSLLP